LFIWSFSFFIAISCINCCFFLCRKRLDANM
jgi:hypothetical protein